MSFLTVLGALGVGAMTAVSAHAQVKIGVTAAATGPPSGALWRQAPYRAAVNGSGNSPGLRAAGFAPRGVARSGPQAAEGPESQSIPIEV
jgi:hypothetical protein